MIVNVILVFRGCRVLQHIRWLRSVGEKSDQFHTGSGAPLVDRPSGDLVACSLWDPGESTTSILRRFPYHFIFRPCLLRDFGFPDPPSRVLHCAIGAVGKLAFRVARSRERRARLLLSQPRKPSHLNISPSTKLTHSLRRCSRIYGPFYNLRIHPNTCSPKDPYTQIVCTWALEYLSRDYVT